MTNQRRHEAPIVRNAFIGAVGLLIAFTAPAAAHMRGVTAEDYLSFEFHAVFQQPTLEP